MDRININHYDLNKIEDCVQFLVDTDELYGDLRGKIKAYEHIAKTQKAREFLKAKGSNAQQCEAQAVVSDAYQSAMDQVHSASTDMEILSAKRVTAALQVEIWRTKSANRRQGTV